LCIDIGPEQNDAEGREKFEVASSLPGHCLANHLGLALIGRSEAPPTHKLASWLQFIDQTAQPSANLPSQQEWSNDFTLQQSIALLVQSSNQGACINFLLVLSWHHSPPSNLKLYCLFEALI